MVKRNQDLRSVPAWMIAEKLGVHENTVYRLLRSELTNEKKTEILAAIEEIKKEMQAVR